MSEDDKTTYEALMGISEGDTADGGGAEALGKRLVAFREWVSKDANIDVNAGVCIVNGEATDGTKNAPVLVYGPPPGAQPIAKNASSGRTGIVDGDADRALYERTMGCQLRAAKELKKDAVLMTVPRSSMVTPDVVAASDAGRALSACCQAIKEVDGDVSYWDTFENTTLCEEKFKQKLAGNTGTQLLVKILQERKRAENAFNKAVKELESSGEKSYKLAPASEISTSAPYLAFLIHQRFSPTENPKISSAEAEDLFESIKQADGDNNAISNAKRIKLSDGSPETFGPYARVLPSSVSLPFCWKRNEIALLTGCLPGLRPLNEIAARTMQLANEFIALLEAGILSRFPSIFPPGLLTWERWVWASAVFSSRNLPSTMYLNEGDKNAASHVAINGEVIMESPPDIFDELGVLVPVLDMCNHELDSNQISWQPCVPEKEEGAMVDDEVEASSNPHPPRAIAHKRIKKGEQLYINYGPEFGNEKLMLSYGFAQMSNKCDEVRLGWGLMDAIGNIPAPDDYVSPFKAENGKYTSYKVYESMEPNAVNEWWSDDRLTLLEQEAFAAVDDSLMSSLKMGKKLTGAAYSDGNYHPILLTAALIGTIPTPELASHISKRKSGSKTPLVVTPRHQHALRDYLVFIFSRKMEKLLENLSNGLKDHFGAVQLWTKATENGLRYKAPEDGAEETKVVGWQTFFDEHAYSATMEVEGRYYAMGPDSCVLTLYDGQLQALQISLDGLETWEKYSNGVLQQLKDLGFELGKEDASDPADDGKAKSVEGNIPRKQKQTDNKASQGSDKRSEDSKDSKKDKDGKSSPSKSSRRRNRKRNNGNAQNPDRPPAIKLHIGNLSYQTTPGDLFEYFARIHGRESVLECHIPTERETGKSRGFGFVTLPEPLARQILSAGRKHEVHGRILKVAESNSAGSNRPNRGPAMPPPGGDRCVTCGYRPKYCVCPSPNIPGGRGDREHEYYRGGEYDYSRQRSRGDRYSRSPSPHRRRREYDYDYDYDRDYRRDRYYDRDRSRSPSYSRGRDRDRDRRRRSPDRDRSRDKSPGRSRDRSRDRGRSRDSRGRRGGSGRDWDRRSSRSSPRRSRSRSRSRSPSYSRRDRKALTGPEKDRRESASPSPGESPRNRESRKRSSRSRSRGRSSKKSKKRRRHRSRSRSASPVDADKK